MYWVLLTNTTVNALMAGIVIFYDQKCWQFHLAPLDNGDTEQVKHGHLSKLSRKTILNFINTRSKFEIHGLNKNGKSEH